MVYLQKMLTYFLKCRKNTESKSPKVARIMPLPKCAVCDSKKSKFVKYQETGRLLSTLGIKTPLNKVPVLNKLLQGIKWMKQ